MRYLLRNGGFCMGGDLIITGGMPLNGTVHIPAAKNSVLPLLAAALCAMARCVFCRCRILRMWTPVWSFAGCGLHGPLAGQRHHGAGRAFHLPPCAGSRRADAGIHFVLRTASGTAWPGGNGVARRVPHWCKAGGPAPFRPCADGRALPGGGGKADPDSACRTARCGHHTLVPQRGCYRDPASGSSCGAGRDGPARGRTRTGDQRSGSIPEPLRRLCTGRGHQHHPGARQTNAV